MCDSEVHPNTDEPDYEERWRRGVPFLTGMHDELVTSLGPTNFARTSRRSKDTQGLGYGIMISVRPD